MGTNTVTVNNAKSRRNFVLADYINNSNLSQSRKTELLLKLTKKREASAKGWVFMMHNPKKLKFDDFERGLAALNRANNADSLGAVEGAFQTQIDVIYNMKGNDLTHEEKNMCLYTLQNMIYGLSDFELPNEKKNDYTPRIMQDLYQMMLKGQSLGMDWDSLYNSVHSDEYAYPKLEWRLLDREAIQNNMENMSRYQATGNDTIKKNLKSQNSLPDDSYLHVDDNGMSVCGEIELTKALDEKINSVLTGALGKFDPKRLKDHTREFFNLVKDSLQEQSKSSEEIDYRVVHKFVLSSMHRFVEIGNRTMMDQSTAQKQTDEGGKSL